jgi:hypothetical protein
MRTVCFRIWCAWRRCLYKIHGKLKNIRAFRASDALAEADRVYLQALSSRVVRDHPWPLARERESTDVPIRRSEQPATAAPRRMALSLVGRSHRRRIARWAVVRGRSSHAAVKLRRRCGSRCESVQSLFAETDAQGLRLPKTKSRRGFPRRVLFIDHRDEKISVLGRPGSDLLFQALRLSTIGAEGFNGRVRYGNGFRPPARTTRSAKNGNASWFSFQCGPFFLDCRVKPGNDEEEWAWEMRTIKIERAIRTGKLNASWSSALTHPAYQRDGLSRLLRENSSRGGFLA